MPRRMSKWEIAIGQGLGTAIALMTFITLASLTAFWFAARWGAIAGSINFGTFLIGLAILVSIVLVILIAYLMYGLTHSVYLLDRNELIIRWGTTEQIVPMGDVEMVFTGDEVEDHIQFSGAKWPGHYVGYGTVPVPGSEPSAALFYATDPPQHQVYVATPGLVYGISPADREGFLESIHQRLQMGPTQVVEQSTKRPNFLSWDIWQDRLGLALLGVSVLALLALIGLLCYRYPTLPRLIPLHFDAAGNVDRRGARVQVFITPLIGMLTLLLNSMLGSLAYRYERMISYMLWGGMLLTQLLIWVAVIGLLGQA